MLIINRSKMEETILDVCQYKHLYRTSYLFLFTCLYGMFRGHYNIAVVPGAFFLTSVNYWRRPVYHSFRRYLDLTVVRTLPLYHHYIVYNAQYANIYFSCFIIGILSYIISCYFYNKKEYWNNIYYHIILHLMANIGTCIVYSGYITV